MKTALTWHVVLLKYTIVLVFFLTEAFAHQTITLSISFFWFTHTTWCWFFTDSACLREHKQPRLRYCSLIQMPGTTQPVQNPSSKARDLMLIGSLQTHSHSPAILLKLDPNLMPRGAAHFTPVGLPTLLQQSAKVFKPKESAALPYGIHNALQHLLLYCELDYLTSFSVSPFSMCLGLSAHLCSFIQVL